MRRALGIVLLALAARDIAAEPSVAEVPLSPGLVMVSALQWEDGDRENVTTVAGLDARGVTYAWHTRVKGDDGTLERLDFRRFVRAVDLEKATRLNTVFVSGDNAEYPGYTSFSLSTAVYDALVAGGESPYTLVSLPRARDAVSGAVAGLLGRTARMRGTLRLESRQPQPFPVLYNGARVTLPTLRLAGSFTGDGRSENVELRVMANRHHPLIVKTITGKDVWQIVRIEMPERSPAKSLEATLARACRAELSGIYFDFASAELDDRSQATLATIAQVLAKNPAWSVTLEGHTDGVGSDATNLKLSAARVNAVREALTRRHGVQAGRIQVAGFGESRPRESNDTVEGRARNRRVELVRDCTGEQP